MIIFPVTVQRYRSIHAGLVYAQHTMTNLSSAQHGVRNATLLLSATALLSQSACTSGDKAAVNAAPQARVTAAPFGALPSGAAVRLFTLTNANGVELRVTDYGGIVTSITTPDRTGTMADIVLGYDSLDGYLKSTPYFGAIVGRYANRLAKARFTLDGTAYALAANNGPNTLHGGVVGFDKVLWRGAPWDSAGRVGIVLTHTSKDGDEGFPGTLTVRVAYTLTDANEFAIDYTATTDKATPINLSQHTYFNLAGAGSGPVLGQRISIDADTFTPVDSTLIPTGVLQPVQGTPFDLRTPTAIGAHIDDADVQLRRGGGYDHNFVINRKADGIVHAARVVDTISGRTLDVATTEPGIQFYSGNFLDGTLTGKNGHVYQRRTGFCLETQHFPDSPNQAAFPSTILRPGAEFRSRTVYTFGVMK